VGNVLGVSLSGGLANLSLTGLAEVIFYLTFCWAFVVGYVVAKEIARKRPWD
jgi:hypothetical protein